MYLNDREGDCTIAEQGHAIQIFTTYGAGHEIRVTDSDVQKVYSAISGYDPKTGANDDGCVIQDTLNYWRKNGLGGHKILAFAEVDVNDRDQVNAALNIFGSLDIGFDFPASAMDQFNNGEIWDVVPGGSPIEGGHAVAVAAYKAPNGNFRVITWGAVQEMTQAFWDRYVTEAWIVISNEWLDATGHSPGGIDLYGLGEDFSALTGNPNPFPAPIPAPPVPNPTPNPVPTPNPPLLDPADEVLSSIAKEWTSHRRTSAENKVLKSALLSWLKEKGL
jgi:hypothetical protein